MLRENWEDALKLQVKDNQTKFVPSVAVSLAKVYIKPDGDAVEYQPFAIYNGDLMVGFVMHAVVKKQLICIDKRIYYRSKAAR